MAILGFNEISFGKVGKKSALLAVLVQQPKVAIAIAKFVWKMQKKKSDTIIMKSGLDAMNLFLLDNGKLHKKLWDIRFL